MELTNIQSIPVSNLRGAPWNFKTEGTPEEIAELAKSIRQDGSAGVLCVRDMGSFYEVIDGNHRLEAVRLLEWQEVRCENFGNISKAVAFTISRRRNYDRFEEDSQKIAELYRDVVLPEISIKELDSYMPDKESDIEDMVNSISIDWGDIDTLDSVHAKTGIKEEYVKLSFTVPKEVFESWVLWQDRVNRMLGYESDWKAFEFALIEALNTPEEVYE